MTIGNGQKDNLVIWGKIAAAGILTARAKAIN